MQYYIAAFLILAAVQPHVWAHISFWNPAMWGFNGTATFSNDPVNPLSNLPFDKWWFHGYLDLPPHAEDVVQLPAGGTFTAETTCDKGATTFWETNQFGQIQNPDNSPCPGSPTSEYHTTGLDDVKGCALAIAYIPPSQVNTIQPDDFTVFSVQQQCVWTHFTDFDVPAAMPACPPGGCTCAWFWIHSFDSGAEQIYMIGFQCDIANATSTVPLAKPQVARRCGEDTVLNKPAEPGNCTYGAKQPLYWLQQEGNNMFEHFNTPPYYNDLYHFEDGAQNDIFEDSVLPEMTWAGAPTGPVRASSSVVTPAAVAPAAVSSAATSNSSATSTSKASSTETSSLSSSSASVTDKSTPSASGSSSAISSEASATSTGTDKSIPSASGSSAISSEASSTPTGVAIADPTSSAEATSVSPSSSEASSAPSSATDTSDISEPTSSSTEFTITLSSSATDASDIPAPTSSTADTPSAASPSDISPIASESSAAPLPTAEPSGSPAEPTPAPEPVTSSSSGNHTHGSGCSCSACMSASASIQYVTVTVTVTDDAETPAATPSATNSSSSEAAPVPTESASASSATPSDNIKPDPTSSAVILAPIPTDDGSGGSPTCSSPSKRSSRARRGVTPRVAVTTPMSFPRRGSVLQHHRHSLQSKKSRF